MSDWNHWDWWSALKMYSQERRMDRYWIIYIWKILEGIAPNVGIDSYTSTMQGHLCQVPQIKIRAISEGSLQIRGPLLFNSLPVNIHGLIGCSVISFKHRLDKHLRSIPDKPKIPGYTIETDLNSITSMRRSQKSWAIEVRQNHQLYWRDYTLLTHTHAHAHAHTYIIFPR